MTQSNLLELAQQGDPQAIAALMNQSLQPRGMTATVERAGDSLSVLLEADQVPNRQTLTAFVRRGISNLGIESIRSVKVLGQQTGTNLPVWTQDLTLELPTTAAEAIDAVDLSPTADSMADLSLTDLSLTNDNDVTNLNPYLSDVDAYPPALDEMELTFSELPEFSSEDSSDELEALWVAPSDEQSQDSLADLDLLAEEPAADLQGLFDEQPEEFEAGEGVDNPLEDLRSLFGEQSEADFPPLEESSFKGANLNSMGELEADSLQDLFGEDLEEDPSSELDGMFSEPTLIESNLGLSNDLGLESSDSDSLAELFGDRAASDLGLESSESDDLAELFGDRTVEEDLGIFEETPPDEEEFQDLFGETALSTPSEETELEGLLEPSSPEVRAPETWSLLDDEISSEPNEESESGDQLLNLSNEEPQSDEQLLDFSNEELLPELSFLEESPHEETLLSELPGEGSRRDFFAQEPEQSEDLTGGLFAEVEEEVSEPLLFNEPLDQPVSFDDLELADLELADLELADQPLSTLEAEQPLANISSSSSKSFQEQQALADFFADDPLADFLAQPVQPSREEFLEEGLSEPMAAATAQGYFNAADPVIDFQTGLNSVSQLQPELEDDQDFLNERFQPEAEPADLFSERMDRLEAEFPQDFQAGSSDQPDRDFSDNDAIVDSLDNWDGALENPLPDVEINQADTISSLENLTDDSDLPNLRTEALFKESSFDRHPETEPDMLQSQPNRWDLDPDEEPTAIENLLPPAIGASGGRLLGAGALEDLTVSLPNLPDDGYEQVAYPSLNDPTQAPPQPKGSPWVFPLVLFGLAGWILALIGFSYWLKDRDTTPPPIVQPSSGSPAPSIPPVPASPSSALPGSEDSAAALPETSDWMAVD